MPFLQRMLCVAMLSLLGGCGTLDWNVLKLAPVEDRARPVSTPQPAPAAAQQAPAPAADAPIRGNDIVVYPRPREFGDQPGPEQLSAPPGVGQRSTPARSLPPPTAAPAAASAAPAVALAAPAPAVAEPPVNPAARSLVEQGRDWQQRGQLEKAAASYERALEIAPDDAWLWHRLAAVRAAQGQRPLARALARRSNALAPADPDLQRANAPLL